MGSGSGSDPAKVPDPPGPDTLLKVFGKINI